MVTVVPCNLGARSFTRHSLFRIRPSQSLASCLLASNPLPTSTYVSPNPHHSATKHSVSFHPSSFLLLLMNKRTKYYFLLSLHRRRPPHPIFGSLIYTCVIALFRNVTISVLMIRLTISAPFSR